MSNLDIWNQVKETDPSRTKGFKGAGGFEGTAINPTYLVLEATKIWGPIGINWGYEVKADYFTDGAPLAKKDTGEHIVDSSGNMLFQKMHTCELELWYMQGEKKGTVFNYGHTPYLLCNKWGIAFDGEVKKKSLTDALKKCLSMLGFAADIYLGDYEDTDYLQMITEKNRIEKAENKTEEAEAIKQEHISWFGKHTELMKTATNFHELETLFKIAIKTLRQRKDNEGIIEITRIKDLRKSQLEEKEKANVTK
jgi:hypothetical protein